MKGLAGLTALALLALPARAEVVDSQANGFTVRDTVQIAASPARVWDALVSPARWWSSDHTFSGDARNLTLTPKSGGLFEETLPGGGWVRHLVVVFVKPPSTLRLEGALGPLQGLGVAGHLTFALKPDGQGTVLAATYDVGGHAPGGLQTLAPAVDGVIGAQIGRLKAAVESGS